MIIQTKKYAKAVVNTRKEIEAYHYSRHKKQRIACLVKRRLIISDRVRNSTRQVLINSSTSGQRNHNDRLRTVAHAAGITN
jgi:hypothetical protein